MINHVAYMAAAGSGKTFALSARYVSLLFLEQSANNILAATFTNKAAAEMRGRVVESLQSIGDVGNEAFLNKVILETGLSKDEILSKKDDVLKKFLKSNSYIVTLDSFFTSILRSSSLEIGLEPDFIVKDISEDNFEEMFLKEVEANGLLKSLVTLAIDIEDQRFKKLLAMMQDLYKQDALILNKDYKSCSLHTIEIAIDNLRDKILQSVQKSGASASAVNNFKPIEVKDLITKSIFEKDSLYEHRNYKKYLDGYEDIESNFQELKNLIQEYYECRENIVLHNLFKSYDYYKNSKISKIKSENILSFDDLSYFTHRLLYETINKDFLYFKLDTKFKHILLDEFQDTSTLQFLLLKPLIDEVFAGTGQSEFRTFFYVGDTKQSLYRFRGGVEELFEMVAKWYSIEIKEMDTNYRSSKNIVNSVNSWFNEAVEGYIPQKSALNALDGYVEVKESEALLNDAVLEAKKLLDLGVNIDQIAFLVQANKDGQKLQELCYKEGIDVVLKTSSSLKSVPKIASLVSMVSYLYSGDYIDLKALLTRSSKSFNDINLDWFHVYLSPFEILHKLIQEFDYYEEDANILKLLEFSSSYRDIPTFLEEFNDSKIDVASSSKHGAQIMTVHGSKGLEFDYVILLDRLTKQPPDTSPILYDYDDSLNIEKVVLRQAKQDNFNTAYKKFKSIKEVASKKDKLNVLYVALTRAVHGMIILKESKNSIFNSLNMEVGIVGNLAINSKAKKSVEQNDKTLNIGSYGLQNSIKSDDNEEMDLEAILFGTALHYTLEMLNGFTLESLGLAMNSTKNIYGQTLKDGQLLDIHNRVKQLITNNQFKSYLEGASYRKEQSISFNGEMKQIDLLLEYEEHNLVVDYKSSKKFMNKHKSQVEFYRKAIESITLKDTQGLIIYLLEDEIEFSILN